MRLSSVDLNLFVVFDVIYTERNLTRAAQVLCLTQPTVSNALARLRKTFNDQLFVRTPQGMVPTPVAENVVARVREALQLLDTSVQEGDQFNPADSERVFRLSMNDISESLLLPVLMGALAEQAPAMAVESYYTRRRDLQRALASGEVDLAIDIPEAADRNICHSPMPEEDYVCLVRQGHPVATGQLTMKRYLALGHVHVSSRRKGAGIVDVALTKLGHQRRILSRLEHYLVAPDIVQRTDLAMTAPRRWALSFGLQELELPFKVPMLGWHLMWHQSADGDQANRWLRERILALSSQEFDLNA